MTSSLEFSARAALCRQLARREPNSEFFWLAEAERWSHLTLAPHAEVVTAVYGKAEVSDPLQAFLSNLSLATAKPN